MAMERGLIQANHPKHFYTKEQVLDLLAACDDFKNELCLLEWIGKKYGVKIVFSAKGYCDVAGFGIEYIWAVAKNVIHRTSLKSRENFEDFEKVFREAMSSTILSLRLCVVVVENAATSNEPTSWQPLTVLILNFQKAIDFLLRTFAKVLILCLTLNFCKFKRE